MSEFKVSPQWNPSGDQPKAIKKITSLFAKGERNVILHGATGTGKSATTAWVIEKVKKPTLIITPNKVLAAQLAAELKELLPNNAVVFFISHFSYYRPEAYLPTSDSYIEKDSAIDDEIERLRQEATLTLLTRDDVVVVASVSAIYGLGRPEEYKNRLLSIKVDSIYKRRDLFTELVEMGYSRNDQVLSRGTFRVKGDTLDIVPSSGQVSYRLSFFDETVEEITLIDHMSGTIIENRAEVIIPPNTHHVFDKKELEFVINDIKEELELRVEEFEKAGKALEAQRIRQRTESDIEQILNSGTCKGIENYSKHFDRRKKGEPPFCLVDYFPDDFLLVVDESHITVSQIEAMYAGDQSRKRTLVDFGFRLPSALDNRPLQGYEFWSKIKNTLFLSATPARRERAMSGKNIVEQVIRPTSLLDPIVEVRENKDRLIDIIKEIQSRVEKNERTLITTLTKRQSEQLSDFFLENNIRAKFLHSEIDTVERLNILRGLRNGEFDVLVGVNLLREGLDLPEVSLICVLDADSEGFLRSETSLIQIIGRAARNINGKVIMYGDKISPAMDYAIKETKRRRELQSLYNLKNDLSPKALVKPIKMLNFNPENSNKEKFTSPLSGKDLIIEIKKEIDTLKKQMIESSKLLRFEEAASLRDEVSRLTKEVIELELL